MPTPQSDGPGVRESRARGGAASWASLAAVALCGGAQGCNSAERAGCEAWADSPTIATGPEKKEFSLGGHALKAGIRRLSPSHRRFYEVKGLGR